MLFGKMYFLEILGWTRLAAPLGNTDPKALLFYNIDHISSLYIPEMPSCFVPNCSHVSGKLSSPANITLYHFPKDCDEIKIWLEHTGMEHSLIEKFSALILADKRRDSFRICSQHFSSDCFNIEGIRRKLKTGSTPTIFTAIPTTSKSYEEKWEDCQK